jgi:hypothetical protein
MNETPEGDAGEPERNARIVLMRDAGMSWLDIQREFGLTRQQARYAYQLGKRAERRRSRRGQN